MNKDKIISIRLTQEEYLAMSHYRTLTSKGVLTQQEFIREAITEKIQKTKDERAGHKLIVHENPKLYGNEESQRKALEILAKCIDELMKSDIQIHFNLIEVLTFAHSRIAKKGSDVFFKQTKERIKNDYEFEKNLYLMLNGKECIDDGFDTKFEFEYEWLKDDEK